MCWVWIDLKGAMSVTGEDETGVERREPLSRDRVLRAAMAFADEHGIDALSMRKLGRELGVEAMSLYKHVANKDDLLDGIAELVASEIHLPTPDTEWKKAMRDRAISARDVFSHHPWAVGIMEARANPGPASMRYYDTVIGSLRRGGFSVRMASRAFSLMDAYVFGYAAQEINLPFASTGDLADIAETIKEQLPADEFPHFTEMILDYVSRPEWNFQEEFEFGLDLILDGLERYRDARLEDSQT